MERPTVLGKLTNLTNYVADQFNYAEAWVQNGSTKTYYYPGTTPAGTTNVYNILMACGPAPSWSPPASCPSGTELSYANLYGMYTLWFYNKPPSY